ncbi:hypothetical protein LLG46_04630 [bacterium]|nr:hypothetical protein [bacterium]
MKKSTIIIAAAILLASSICYGAVPPPGEAAGLIPPPAINIPYGGTIIVEVNISDDNILGIIKQTIPAVAAALDEVQKESDQENAELPGQISLISNLQLKTLGEVIDSIKGVRLVVAKYNKNVVLSDLIHNFEKGLAKVGTYSKVASGLDILPGAAGLYAEAGNAGYVGFAYDSHERMLYAVRVIGSMDVSKLAAWTIRAMTVVNKMGTVLPGTSNAEETDN